MTVKISENALKILKERYLMNGESVEGMFKRVANSEDRFYNLLTSLRFLPNCLSLNTRIACDGGIRHLRTIAPGNINLNVATDEGMKPATQCFGNGPRQVIKLRTKKGYTVTSTPDHLFRIIDDQGEYVWKRAGNLSNGDWMALQMGFLGEAAILPLETKISRNSPSGRRSTPVRIPETLSPKLATFLGFYFGNGCGKKYTTQIAVCGRDPDVATTLAVLTEDLFGIAPKIGKIPNKDCYSLEVYRRQLIDFLNINGLLKPKSTELRVPDLIWKGGREIVASFLSGLFEADGTVGEKAIEYFSSSKEMIEEVQLLLLGLGISSRITNSGKTLIINRGTDGSVFVSEVGMLSRRKNSKLKEFVNPRRNAKTHVIPNQKEIMREWYKSHKNHAIYKKIARFMIDGPAYCEMSKEAYDFYSEKFPSLRECPVADHFNRNQIYDKLESITKVQIEETADLHVPSNHTFIADGFVSHNSPTLFNAGLNNGCTLSACFTFCVEDSMFDSPSSIVNTRAKAIAVAKAGGGVGYYLGDIRPKGSPIKSTHRKACGPVAVLKDYQAISALITQGGKRDLAQMAVLPVFHPDIKEFIHVKDSDPQGLASFNISASWPKKWIDESITYDVPSQLWNEQVESAWSHGCPGMFFPDTVNKSNPNPHLGLWLTPNPCGEVPGRNAEACNLGSLSLPRYFNPGNRDVNWKLLEEDVITATEFLDDILDRNVFPHPDITKATALTRKLGLGVMGWADLLAMMHIHYDSQKAIDLARSVMKLINDVALQTSINMAKTKGPYKGYSDKTEGPCARNETRTSIAPTGTIAIIADVFGGIEPHFSLDLERTTKEGHKLQESWDRYEGFVPKTASEIPPEWHVKHQAAFQEYVNLAVSKTINLPNSATKEDVSRIYRMMHDSGCKGGTIFRDGCRNEQVLVKKNSTTKSVFSTGIKSNLPNTRESKIHKFRVGGVTGFLSVGLYPNGKVGEIFLTYSKMGSSTLGMLNAWAITCSVALQHGTPLEELCEHHIGTRFEPCGLTDDKDVPICTSVPDYVCRWLLKHFSKEKESKKGSGQLCPDCGGELTYQSGCLVCPTSGCGWTRCS